MSSLQPYVIASACRGVKDGSCVTVCPVDCIYTHPEEPQYYIHPDECIDCGSCETVCPVQAIFRLCDLPQAEAPAAEANRDYFVRRPDFRSFHRSSWT